MRIGFLLFLPLVLGFQVDDDDQGDQSVACCRGYCSVPGPLQSVQRAELWGVILALQASRGVHLGVESCWSFVGW